MPNSAIYTPQKDTFKTVLSCCRNLSLGGGPDVCIKMVEQDVMTPLGTLVQQVRETS